MNRLAIIPARGGSKRIPRKNIKNFLGKPIIAYSIEAALGSELFDEVMVSTDDEEVAEFALKFGAKVPFLRSKENSNDHATLAEVVSEVLDKYQSVFNFNPDCITTILATAPFVNSFLLKEAFFAFETKEVDSLISVSEFPSSIYKSFRLNSNSELEFNFPQYLKTRSQDLPKSFYDAGQFYIFKTKAFSRYKKLSGGKSHFFNLPSNLVQDIDTNDDWQFAEQKFKFYKKKINA